MEWKQYKLGDVLTIKYGKDHKKLADGLIPVYGSGGIMRYADTCIYDKPSILIPRKGSLNNIFYVDKPFWTVDTMFWSMIDTNVVDPYFLYCAICKYDFAGLNVGSAVPSLTVPIIEAVELSLPPLPTQRRIAAILSSLDAQIENNNRINANLEAQAQALFKSWFVDFEPWGGVMPKGWKEGNIYDVADIYDKYRKPLSGNQRDAMKKIYPYYGATSVMDYVDNYIFDGIYTLLGEDGSVVKEDGTPYVQYIWGKVWVNNHAHVLQGKNGYSTEMLHVLFSQLNIKSLVTGAVQAKLNQGNMKNIIVLIPTEPVLKTFRECINSLYAQIRNNTEANARLASLRDTLLPKLMKGEIEV